MYTVVNSRAYDAENLETGLMGWQVAAIIIDVVAAGFIITLEIILLKKYKKRKEELIR